MNVIVANKYIDLLNNSNIQIMKAMSGVFKVSEIANSFNGMYYQKIIIDATALDGFPKQEVLKDLTSKFDTEKLILFLPPDNSPPKNFLSFLVSINIYNFTDNIKGLVQLVNRSNSYDDVKNFVVEDIKTRLENKNYENDILPNRYNNQKIILWMKNFTYDKKSNKITYMLKENLKKEYQKNVIALEIDKKDFIYFNDKNMLSISKNKLEEIIKNINSSDIVIVDVDKNTDDKICNDIIYLIDPSLYRINELMFKNKRVFEGLRGKKVILVNSLLEQKDINIFASEAGISVYFNLPPLNDRIINPCLNELLYKLGIVENNENDKKSIFDFFK